MGIFLFFRLLATGETFRSLSFAFRISSSYISVIIRETLDVLCSTLVPIFLPPYSREDLKEKASEFLKKMGFSQLYCRNRWKTHPDFLPKKQ